jgi:hypothetical protein
VYFLCIVSQLLWQHFCPHGFILHFFQNSNFIFLERQTMTNSLVFVSLLLFRRRLCAKPLCCLRFVTRNHWLPVLSRDSTFPLILFPVVVCFIDCVFCGLVVVIFWSRSWLILLLWYCCCCWGLIWFLWFFDFFDFDKLFVFFYRGCILVYFTIFPWSRYFLFAWWPIYQIFLYIIVVVFVWYHFVYYRLKLALHFRFYFDVFLVS